MVSDILYYQVVVLVELLLFNVRRLPGMTIRDELRIVSTHVTLE